MPEITQAQQLTGDQLHVLLDVVGTVRRRGDYLGGGYDSDPAEDPKASETGWKALLADAEDVLTDQLNRAPWSDAARGTVATSTSGDTTWTPWTDGFAVGFRVANRATGAVRYVYLNPSTEGSEDPGGDRGTTFLYRDDTGDSADGMTVTWLDVLAD